MRQFPNYSVMVNYNLHTQLKFASQETALHRAKQFQQEKDLSMKVARTSDATLKEFLWKQELEDFENSVFAELQTIYSNPVGRKVLDFIDKRTTVWIVPKDVGEKREEDKKKACTCAMTGPLDYDIPKDGSYAYGSGSGDTVIRFDPSLGDDTLLHELVHAYRYSCGKYKFAVMLVEDDSILVRDKKHPKKTTGYKYQQMVEEFFAHEMENIYRSQTGGRLTQDYTLMAPGNKNDVYNYLALNDGMVKALKDLVAHDLLASTAARCFTTDYNSFRDYADIEQRNTLYDSVR